MIQYIDKSTVVAEIERRIKEHHSGYLVCLKDILSFLDTLEVKETELKKGFELTWEDVAWIVNEVILKCKVESILTAKDICKDVLNQFKAHKGE